MASTSFASLLIISIVTLAVVTTVTGRNIPGTEGNSDEKLQPQWLGYHIGKQWQGHHEGTVLVPGIGRFKIPDKHAHINPITYNPITGTNTGSGAIIPSIGNIGGGSYIPGGGATIPSIGNIGGGSYIPGGDDTLLPNPGVEVPNPAGGGIPSPTQH